MSLERKVYTVSKAGNIKNLRMKSDRLAEPTGHEVLIQVHSIGLNFADVFAILGLYSATPEGEFIPGLEFSGVIIDTGKDVTHFKNGDRVMGVTRFGGYASHVLLEEEYLTSIPDSWNYEEGAAFLVQGLTAYYGLFTLGNLARNETVLIHSAAGGVGLMAHRMAKKMNAYTIGTIGSEHKRSLLEEEGYDQIIIRSKRFGKDLENALDGRSLDVVMECIGGRIFTEAYERLAPRGRMIVYGSARYGSPTDRPNWPKLIWLYLARPKIDPQKMIENNKSIHGFNLIWLYDRKELMRDILREMGALNLPAPLVGHRYPFDKLPDAIRHFQSGSTTGKVVVNI